MSSKHDELLKGVAATAGVASVLLATRDGLPVGQSGRKALDADTFAAMFAAALGAVEAAATTHVDSIEVRTEQMVYRAQGVTNELLVVAASEPGADGPAIEAAIKKVAVSLSHK